MLFQFTSKSEQRSVTFHSIAFARFVNYRWQMEYATNINSDQHQLSTHAIERSSSMNGLLQHFKTRISNTNTNTNIILIDCVGVCNEEHTHACKHTRTSHSYSIRNRNRKKTTTVYLNIWKRRPYNEPAASSEYTKACNFYCESISEQGRLPKRTAESNNDDHINESKPYLAERVIDSTKLHAYECAWARARA